MKAPERRYRCDRCGVEMIERNCKITCPNCGNRFDCSDLNIHLNDPVEAPQAGREHGG